MGERRQRRGATRGAWAGGGGIWGAGRTVPRGAFEFRFRNVHQGRGAKANVLSLHARAHRSVFRLLFRAAVRSSEPFRGSLPAAPAFELLSTLSSSSSSRGSVPPPLRATGEAAAAASSSARDASTLASKDDAGTLGNSGASPVTTGFPEVVFGEGKDPKTILNQLIRISNAQGLAAATRVPAEVAVAVRKLEPRVQHDRQARMLVLRDPKAKAPRLPGSVGLVAAGSADPAVVEECRLLLQCLGCYSFMLPESGVMGMHRLVQNLDAVRAADVVVCATGPDGSIAAITAGLVDAPVIVLPTSTGYGAAFGGVAPLIGALNAAAPGVAVVNIDSGFGAAMAAWRILNNARKVRQAVLDAATAAGKANSA